MKVAKKVQAKKVAKPRKTAPVPAETVLVLRTCKADMTSHNGFLWPASGPVEAPDWSPRDACGQGLHGWLWGIGNWSLKAQGENIKWLVVEVPASQPIDLDGKVKFRSGIVVAVCDKWPDAMAIITTRLKKLHPEAISAVGDGEFANSGYYGHSSSGDSGHSSSGYSGHSFSGDYGHSSSGYSGHSFSGYYGHSFSGYYGHSSSGDYGHSSSGYSGHSSSGDYGWSVTTNGRAKAAANGTLTIRWWDEKSERHRVTTGYVGEEGIKSDTWYVVEHGKLVEVPE